jgi:hypothetical protein
VQGNVATDADSGATGINAVAMDWSALAAVFDDFTLTAGRTALTATDDFAIGGTAAIGVQGYVLAIGTFDVVIEDYAAGVDVRVNDGTGPVDRNLATAQTMFISLRNLSLFAGVGGAPALSLTTRALKSRS